MPQHAPTVVREVCVIQIGITRFVLCHLDDRARASHPVVQVVKQETVFAGQIALHGYDSRDAAHGMQFCAAFIGPVAHTYNHYRFAGKAVFQVRIGAVEFCLIPFNIIQGVGDGIQADLEYNQVIVLVFVELMCYIRPNQFKRAAAVSPNRKIVDVNTWATFQSGAV